MPDLFDYKDYPERPGHKRTSTSLDAAKAISPKKAAMEAKVLNTLRSCPEGAISSEIAIKSGLSILSVRPRLSELFIREEIIDTGLTRKNESGRSETLWKSK